MAGADQQLDSVWLLSKGFVDIIFTIPNDAYLGRASLAELTGDLASRQPALAFLVFDRAFFAARLTAAFVLQKLSMHEAEDGTGFSLDRNGWV